MEAEGVKALSHAKIKYYHSCSKLLLFTKEKNSSILALLYMNIFQNRLIQSTSIRGGKHSQDWQQSS